MKMVEICLIEKERLKCDRCKKFIKSFEYVQLLLNKEETEVMEIVCDDCYKE